jgi:hypothetical protein
MNTLLKQVRLARRRLFAQQWVAWLPWCVAVASLAAVAAVVANAVCGWQFEPWTWAAAWLGGAWVVGLLATAVAAWFTCPDALQAAIEIDHRLGLKERVSSALAMDEAQRQSEAGRALLDDAQRRVRHVDLAASFRVRPDRYAALPLAPLAAVVLLAALLPRQQQASTPGTPDASAAQQAQVKPPVAQLQRALTQQQQTAQHQGLDEAQQWLERLQQGLRDLNATSPKEALVRLNELAQQLQERQRELRDTQSVKEHLAQLRDLASGPRHELAAALRDGDWKRALEALDKLQQQMRDAQLDPQQREKLARQLEQMRDKLQQLAAQQQRQLEALQQQQQQVQQQMESLRQQIAAAEQAGDQIKAQQLQQQLAQAQQQSEKLQQQIDRLANQASQMAQMQQMADQLGQCAQCLRDGQSDQAAQTLGQMQGQLTQLQQAELELQMLDDAMQQISLAKNQLTGSASSQQQAAMGDGLGQGRGQGRRPEDATDTQFVDVRDPAQVGRGAAIQIGEIRGPNVKGQVRQAIVEQQQAFDSREADPIVSQQLPRGAREHTREYFDLLREK